jgi:hypothetical protein
MSGPSHVDTLSPYDRNHLSVERYRVVDGRMVGYHYEVDDAGYLTTVATDYGAAESATVEP